MGAIMTTAEVESALSFYETTYPTLCNRIELPNKTIENRTCHALRMGLPNAPGNPAGLVIGGVHAREWAGPDIVVSFAGDILKAYTNGKGLQYAGKSFSAADIKQILERSTIVVFPCVNPDGVEFSHTNTALWRKNRNPAVSDGDAAKVGVDINRNYDFLWDFKKFYNPAAWNDSLASDDPSSETFHGPAPFSEPETRNVRWLMDTFAGLRLFLDLHSYTGDVLYNWGDDNNQNTDPAMNFANSAYDGQRGVIDTGYGEYLSAADEAATTAIAATIRDAMNAVRGRAYVAKQGIGLYPTAGASDDYAFARHFVTSGQSKMFGYVIEFNFVGDGDIANPPTDPFLATGDPAIYDLTLRDVIPGLIAFSLQAPRAAAAAGVSAAAALEVVSRNPATGEASFIGGDGKVYKTPPLPEPHRSTVANEIWRLVNAYEAVGSVGGEGGRIARQGLLRAIQEIARGASETAG
jgi:murein tripeptide amidase MpaA